MSDYDDARYHEDSPPAADRPPPNTSSKNDDRMLAMFCHLGGIIGGFLVPLIIWLIKKEESSYIDHHGKEALNFQITMMIGHVIAGALACFTFGLSSMVVLAFTITFSIIAAMAANRGERYEYPVTIRLIQ